MTHAVKKEKTIQLPVDGGSALFGVPPLGGPNPRKRGTTNSKKRQPQKTGPS